MNQKKYLYFAFLIFLVLCGSFALQAVCSAELDANDSDVVTQQDDILVQEQPESSDVLKAENEASFDQLSRDISTGDTVDLAKNYTFNTDDTTGGITISRDVTINGKGNVIIDGKNQARIFNINDGATVTFKGITFINAYYNGDGGAISVNNGIINLEDCNFIDNTAGNRGGAIYIANNNIAGPYTIKNCNFINNKALRDGIINSENDNKKFEIENSVFENNSVQFGWGGALRLNANSVTIKNSKFRNNSITAANGNNGFGAAVYATGQDTIDNCTFTENTITGNSNLQGGAVYLKGDGNNITNSIFANNSITAVNSRDGLGGALYIEAQGSINNCNFTGNSVKGTSDWLQGGAIVWKNSNSEIQNSYFADNFCEKEGGALFFECWNGNPIVKIKKSTFKNNTANTQDGGAINVKAIDSFVLDDCQMIGNNARDGGAIYVGTVGSFVLDDCQMIDNNAQEGGAIYLNPIEDSVIDNCIMSNCKMIDNKAQDGGAIYVGTVGSFVLDDCQMIGNKASSDVERLGGAIYFNSQNTEYKITDSNFTDNFAFCGGAIGANGTGMSVLDPYALRSVIDNCIFVNNSAIGRPEERTMANRTGGGAIFAPFGCLNLTNSIFSGNFLEIGHGGAVLIGGVTNNVINCKFYNNTIHGNTSYEGNPEALGGALYITTEFITSTVYTNLVDHCTFINNSITANHLPMDKKLWLQGGAFAFAASKDGILSNCYFEENYCEHSGGAVYFAVENGIITNCIFKNNTANGTKYLLEDDEAFQAGGAIILKDRPNMTLANSTILDNHAKSAGGGVFIHVWEWNVTVYNCTIKNNTATVGGGIYIFDGNSHIISTDFIGNAAIENGNKSVDYSGDGGAIAVGRDASRFNCTGYVNDSNFIDNFASFYGGAIFLENTEDWDIFNSNFTHNKARNGSAVYNDRTKVNFTKEVTFENVTFNENQAWSYMLNVTANPESSYYHTQDVDITVTFIGGDNIINAIHNRNSNDTIHFINVTYKRGNGEMINTGTDSVSPVMGVENSKDGTLLYQDAREDLQNVTVTVTYLSGTNTAPGLLGAVFDSITYSGETDIYGQFNITISKYDLKVGNYSVLALHPEDWNYKEISNSTFFEVIGYVDLSVNKTSDKNAYFIDDIVVWTIEVSNAGNASNATNVTLKDILPDAFEYINHTASAGTYNSTTGIWTIGTLNNGTKVKLTITSRAVKIVDKVTNVASVTSNEKDWNLTNNVDNQTVTVFDLPDPEKTVNNSTPYCGDIIEYNLTINNNMTVNYDSNLTVIDSLPEGLEYVETVGITNGDIVKFDKNGQKLTWIISNIKANSKAVITIKVLVKGLGNLTNNLTIVSPENRVNKTVNCTVVPVPAADLEVTKLVSNNTPHKNDKITWTIVVTNKGPNTAYNITVTDKLPDGLIYDSDDSKGAYDPKTGILTIDNLPNGESITINIITIVNATNTTIVNIVNVTSDIYDSNETNNNATNSTYIPPEADLDISKVVNATVAHKGDVVVWTVTVVNNGPDAAVNVSVKDVIPSTLINDGVTVDIGELVDNVWIIEELASGKTAVMTIRTVVNATNTTITNIANVTSDTYDPNETNNNATNSTYIPPEADLDISKVVNATVAHKGDVVVWTVTVVNNGPDAAVNVSVKDVIPSTLINDGVTVDIGELVDNVWFISELASGKTAVMTIRTVVNATNTTITNIANVTSDTYDPNETNDNATNSTYIPPEADLIIIKDADKHNVKVGDKVKFTIAVINLGPDSASKVRVKELLPKGFKLVSYKVSKGTYNVKSGVWDIGDMKNQSTVTLTIVAEALFDGTIVNKVYVESDTYDPDESNNDASASVKVKKSSNHEGTHIDFDYDFDIDLDNNNADADADSNMHATGNPFVMAILALLAMAGVTLRRKD